MNGASGAQTFLSFPSGSKTAARSVTSFSSSTRASILRIFLSESFCDDEPPLEEEPFFIEPPWTMVAGLVWFRAWFEARADLLPLRVGYATP